MSSIKIAWRRRRVTFAPEIGAPHDAEIWKNEWIWEFGMKIGVETRVGNKQPSDIPT